MASSSSLLFDTQEEADLNCLVFTHLRVCPSTGSWASSCDGTDAVRLIKPKLDQFQTSSPRCFCSHNEHSPPCFFRVVDFAKLLYQDWGPELRVHECYVGSDRTKTAKLTKALQRILGLNERDVKQVYGFGRGCIFGWQLNVEEPIDDNIGNPCLAAKCAVNENTLLPGAKLLQFRMEQAAGADSMEVEMGPGSDSQMEQMVGENTMEVEMGLGGGSEVGGSVHTADDDDDVSIEPTSPPSPSPHTVSGWRCLDCNNVNDAMESACTGKVRGRPCNTARSNGLPLEVSSRRRTQTQHLVAKDGTAKTHEAGPKQAHPTGGRGKGKGGRNYRGRGKGRKQPSESSRSPPVEAAATIPPPDDLEGQLAEIVGMHPLKIQLRKFHQTCKDHAEIRALGQPTLPLNYHMVLAGNPGTGKTTVARLLERMLQSAGVVKVDSPFIEFKASHAEGENLGEARVKVQELINRARGGILFVDEAHNLTMHKDNMYGQQAASQLMDCLQDGNTDLSRRVIVVYAGYAKEMQKMIASDAGYTRRIDHIFKLPDYTPTDLAEIFLKMAAKAKRSIGDGVTILTISKVIKESTDDAYRSMLNGTVAETLLKATESAMCDRLRPGGFEGASLSYEAADVTRGAEVFNHSKALE